MYFSISLHLFRFASKVQRLFHNDEGWPGEPNRTMCEHLLLVLKSASYSQCKSNKESFYINKLWEHETS